MLRVIYAQVALVATEPVLSSVSKIFGKRKVDRAFIVVEAFALLESEDVLVEVSEVLFSLLAGGRAQSLVVLSFVRPAAWVFPLPLLEVGDCKETTHVAALAHLNDRRHELLDKAADLEQTRPKVVDEVDDEALDVGAVVVLVGHNHD